MFHATSPARSSSRADHPYNPGRHRASFARQAVIAEFGWHFAKALDQSGFIDRPPGEMPKSSPEARFFR